MKNLFLFLLTMKCCFATDFVQPENDQDQKSLCVLTKHLEISQATSKDLTSETFEEAMDFAGVYMTLEIFDEESNNLKARLSKAIKSEENARKLGVFKNIWAMSSFQGIERSTNKRVMKFSLFLSMHRAYSYNSKNLNEDSIIATGSRNYLTAYIQPTHYVMINPSLLPTWYQVNTTLAKSAFNAGDRKYGYDTECKNAIITQIIKPLIRQSHVFYNHIDDKYVLHPSPLEGIWSTLGGIGLNKNVPPDCVTSTLNVKELQPSFLWHSQEKRFTELIFRFPAGPEVFPQAEIDYMKSIQDENQLTKFLYDKRDFLNQTVAPQLN